MPTLTGYAHATTPLQILKGPAVLFVGGVPHSSSQGVRVEFTTEIRQPQIDGLATPLAGLDHPVAYAVRVTGRFLELSEAQIARYLNGVAGVVAGTVTTSTPRAAGAYLPNPAGYVADVEVRILDGAENTHAVAIPLAHVSGWPVDGEDRSEVGVALTLEARSEGATAAAPWTYTVTEAGAEELVLTSISITPTTVELDGL